MADLLTPRGVLHLTEFHPMAGTIDGSSDTATLCLRYPYFRTDEPVRFDDDITYTDNPVGPIANTVTYEWGHGIGEILTAVLDAGLRLTSFTEHRASYFRALPQMQFTHGLWRLPPAQRDLLPLTFSLSARKD